MFPSGVLPEVEGAMWNLKMGGGGGLKLNPSYPRLNLG